MAVCEEYWYFLPLNLHAPAAVVVILGRVLSSEAGGTRTGLLSYSPSAVHSPDILLRSTDEYISRFLSTGRNFQQEHFHLF